MIDELNCLEHAFSSSMTSVVVPVASIPVSLDQIAGAGASTGSDQCALSTAD